MVTFVLTTCLLLQPPHAEPPKPQETVQNPELMKEIQERTKKDQAARKAIVEFMGKHQLSGRPVAGLDPKVKEEFEKLSKAVEEADAENIKWLKDVVAKHGWPGKSMVGKPAAFSAWLLVQHCDRDRDFQEKCLKMMKALPKGEVEPRNIAYLTDRVLVGRGKKQIYGTQGMSKDGKTVASPIEDEANVDQRRKEVGLGPLAEYLDQLNKLYNPKGDKKAEEKTEEKKGDKK